jgi:hypothetical protein
MILRTRSGYSSKPEISLGEIETPPDLSFFFSSGEALGLGDGVSVGLGDSSGEGVGDGELFFFFETLGDGKGDGERFGFGVASSSASCFGDGEGDAFFVGEADGEGVGDAFFLGDGDGDGVALLVDGFFFFFGGGVGSKICLILSPNDGSLRTSGTTASVAQMTATPTDNARVIPSQRRRRGTSHRALRLRRQQENPSTLCEVPRRAAPAPG